MLDWHNPDWQRGFMEGTLIPRVIFSVGFVIALFVMLFALVIRALSRPPH
jgi:hypothetical protein